MTKTKLLNPFLLIGEGFVVGAALFFTTAGEQPAPAPMPTAAQTSVQPIAGV